MHKIATGDGPHAGTGLGEGTLEPTQRGKRREAAHQPAYHRQCQVSQQRRTIAVLRRLVGLRSAQLLQGLQLAQLSHGGIAPGLGHAQKGQNARQAKIADAKGFQKDAQLVLPCPVMLVERISRLLLFATQ
ncbi:hypothetical protein D3C73_1376230 [compost metagenome]